MIRFILGFVAAALILGGIWFFTAKSTSQEQLDTNSAMIQHQIQQVGKLVVTEGYYTQVFNYKNSQKIFLNLVRADKKALIVVNTKATVEYDLRKLQTKIDEESKTLTILNIPEPVINIYPEFEYYDVTQDYLNQFEGKDYNKIKTSITAQVRKKIEESDLKKDGQERLISELFNLYILTKSLGWTLQYNELVIDTEDRLRDLK